MKNNNKRGIGVLGSKILLLLTVFAFASCQKDFETANTDPNGITDKMLDFDYRWASYLTTMQRMVFPEDENDYQRAFNLTGDIYCGYFGATDTWLNGVNGTTYAFVPDWYGRPYIVLFQKTLAPWLRLQDKGADGTVIGAIANIVKVTAAHRVADMHGALPYTKYGIIHENTPYDTLEELYHTFIEELDDAVELLETFVYNNGASSRPAAKFDLIYGSDLVKWIKYGNSLKLRLAMRIRYADRTAADEYMKEVFASTYGVIETTDEIAKAGPDNSLGISTVNSMKPIWDEYANARLGATLQSYMEGYGDPRLDKWFTASVFGHYGVRNGITMSSTLVNNYVTYASKPNIERSTPMVWMTAAEVWFLRAEAAIESLGGLTPAEAEAFYEKGIRASFEEHGLSSEVAAYLANTSTPADYDDFFGSNGASALSTITIPWDEADDKETKLERIITQKWIAMYPNGAEGWAEFRRTGYPKVFPNRVNHSAGTVDDNIQVRRIPFPQEEWMSNNAQVQKIVDEEFGGQDTGGVKLWWDKK